MMAEGALFYFEKKKSKEIDGGNPTFCFFLILFKKTGGAPPTTTSIKIEGKYSERYVRTVGGLKQINPSFVIR
jgi:hypothetical protein